MKPHETVPAAPERVPHMSIDEFRSAAHEMIDLICEYHRTVHERPVAPTTEPGEVFGSLPDAPPLDPEPIETMLGDVRSNVLPNLMHWQHPGFFGYFPANSSWPAVLGDLLSTGLGVQGMLWQTSPACTEIEQRVMDWLALALGLPASFTHAGKHPDRLDPEFARALGEPMPSEPDRLNNGPGGGVILGTASEATLTALVAGLERHRRRNDGRQPVAYCSSQAHSSFVKAAAIAGLGRDRMRLVPTDDSLAMDPGALRTLVERDAAEGLAPVFIGLTLGTTGTGAFDPIEPVLPIAREHNAWLHADAAWAGAAFVCPEHRGPLAGIGAADSISFNPHKWLLTNFDCSAFFLNGGTAKRELIEAMSITPEYLRNAASETGTVTDFRDWHIPLGRRFRALKLWFVMRHYGLSGLQAYIRSHIREAEALERALEADERFEVVAPRSLSLLCVALRAGDEPTRRVMDRINRGGHVFVTHTTIPHAGGDRFVIRVAIGGTNTGPDHVRTLWQELRVAADDELS